ncbi:hypothetical protein HY949_03830 [Candidatus Gottesmanbacteria bacterium]|nr:hypothetical protein [Candidatus Gottesmanbacteria bacterium]
MLTDDEKNKLKTTLAEAMKNSYPKGATTTYAAAALTKSGNVYAAAQYFSDTYSLTLHGEQCALVHAAAHGEGEIVAMAVLSNEKLEKGQSTQHPNASIKGAGFTPPCHMCKQLLYESQKRSGIPMTILLCNESGEEKELPLDAMLGLYPWPK